MTVDPTRELDFQKIPSRKADRASAEASATAAFAEALAADAAESFNAAALQPDEMADRVMWGLGRIVEIVQHPGMTMIASAAADRLGQSIVDLGPTFVARFAGLLRGDLAVTGLAGAVGLAGVFGKTSAQVVAVESEARVLDYFDHVMLLKTELEALCLRDRIERRGAPREFLASIRTIRSAPHGQPLH